MSARAKAYLRTNMLSTLDTEPNRTGQRDGHGPGAPEPRPERNVGINPTGEPGPTQLENVKAITSIRAASAGGSGG
jgi:hypothetical protein